MRSEKNKTIDISIEEGREYLERCIVPSSPCHLEDILCKTLMGNSFEIMKMLPHGFADLAIIDPPYNLRKDYHGNVFSEKSSAEYERYTESWIALIKPLLKNTASIYVCCDWRSSMIIGPVLSRHFKVRNRITWQREKGRGAGKNFKNSMEDIWFATVSDDYHFDLDAVKIKKRVIAPYRKNGRPKDWVESDSGNYRLTCPSNFWNDITVPFWSMPENTAHPTQKPEKLLAKLILASSRPGEVVFDPFLGSGSGSVTAKKLGRNYVGIEQNPLYCVWAEKRLEMAEENQHIQGFENGIFLDRNANM